MLSKTIILSFIGFLMSFNLTSAEPYGSHASAKWQIWAYSSAAPSFIGDNATITGSNGETLREGNNGWTCASGNPRPVPAKGWKSPHEAMPTCHDKVGVQWMKGYMAGEKPQMERDTYMWMLHGDLGEDNTTSGVLNKTDAKDQSQFIVSGPHLMLMPKDPTSLDNLTDDFTLGVPYVMFKGTDYAHVMIPVDDYYKYQPQSAPK